MASDDILIVDDEQDIRDLVAGILSDEGFTVRTAADADSALASLRGRSKGTSMMRSTRPGRGVMTTMRSER